MSVYKIAKFIDEKIPDDQIKIVIVAVEDEHGRVLVVRRSLTETNRPGYWEMPGGHIDLDESIGEAAKREVREEIGIPIQLLDKRSYFTLDGEDGYGVCVKGRAKSTDLRLKLDEHDRAVWKFPKNLGEFKKVNTDFEKVVRKVTGSKFTTGEINDVSNGEDIGNDDADVSEVVETVRPSRPAQKSKPGDKDSPRYLRESPEEVVEGTEAVEYNFDDPPQSAMFGLFDDKTRVSSFYSMLSGDSVTAAEKTKGEGNPPEHPDYDEFEEEDIPTSIDQVFQRDGIREPGKEHWGDTYLGAKVHDTVLKAVDSVGLGESVRCTDQGDGCTAVNLDDPRTASLVRHAVRRAGLIDLPFTTAHEVVVAAPRVAVVRKCKGGWCVKSHKGKNLGGPYKSKGQAEKRLRQVEYFKRQGSRQAEAVTGSRIKECGSQWCVVSKEGKPLGKYKTKEAALERLRAVKYYSAHPKASRAAAPTTMALPVQSIDPTKSVQDEVGGGTMVKKNPITGKPPLITTTNPGATLQQVGRQINQKEMTVSPVSPTTGNPPLSTGSNVPRLSSALRTVRAKCRGRKWFRGASIDNTGKLNIRVACGCNQSIPKEIEGVPTKVIVVMVPLEEEPQRDEHVVPV